MDIDSFFPLIPGTDVRTRFIDCPQFDAAIEKLRCQREENSHYHNTPAVISNIPHVRQIVIADQWSISLLR